MAAALGLAHLALFIHDLASTAGFFRADRATQRFNAMRALLGSLGDHDAMLDALVRKGNIGDYGVHAALYWLGGPLAVIVLQILLAIAAALAVVYIAWRAFKSRGIALAAGLLYGLLPQSLAFPHQLLSEAVSNPCLILGTAGVLLALEQPRRWVRWLTAGLALGLAGLVRPALILVAPMAAVLLLMLDRGRASWTRSAALLLAGLVPFVLWGSFIWSQTGKFGPGESNQDLGLNFSQSTGKVLLSEGIASPDGTAPGWLPKRLTLEQYAHYVSTYPAGFANLYFKNALVMVTDSGIGRLYVDLLGFGADERLALQDPARGWRAQLTNHGPLAMLRQGWRVAPGTMIAGTLGALGFFIVNVGMLAAYVASCRRRSPLRDRFAALDQRWCLAFLLLLPLYVLATSEVVAYAPSRLRSQGEFAVAILACYGWTVLRDAWRARREMRSAAVPA
ncbi:MAG TPA: glycosyltransferase family 39 protein [Steroidobacteraceae bacterium]|nr:glycosyltransferase family 39 protein [Steroidobacteraceae bacterium]